MDKLGALKTALDEILDDDHVALLDDGSYEVQHPEGGASVFVKVNDRGDWAGYLESGLRIPHSAHHDRPNEVVAWALL